MRASLTALAIVLMAALHAGQPGAAEGQQLTCGAGLSVAYVAGPAPASPGDTIRVRLRFSTGDIGGGTTFTVNRVRFDLDCSNPPVPGAVGCLDDGEIIAYGGDNTITTNCQVNARLVNWSTGHAADGVVNAVVFTPSDPIVIPANEANHCELQFDVNVLMVSDDSTPDRAEEVAGFDAAQSDGQCDNGLAASTASSAAIQLAATTGSSSTTNTTTSTAATTTPADADNDGVPDADEACFCVETFAASPVTALGCSIDQLCPCAAPLGRAAWTDHGEYFSCVRGAARELEARGVLTPEQGAEVTRAAARSDCGR